MEQQELAEAQQREALRQKALEMFIGENDEYRRGIMEKFLEIGSISPTTQEEQELLDQIGTEIKRGDGTYSVGRHFPLERSANPRAPRHDGAMVPDDFMRSDIPLPADYDAVVTRDFKLVIPRSEADQIVTESKYPNPRYLPNFSPAQNLIAKDFHNLVDRRDTMTIPGPGRHDTPEEFSRLAKVDRAIGDSIRTQIVEREKGPKSRIESQAA